MSYGLGEKGFVSWKDQKIFSFPKRHISWIPGFIWADRAVKSEADCTPDLVGRFRMSGAKPPPT
jgi:hypothetical protein